MTVFEKDGDECLITGKQKASYWQYLGGGGQKLKKMYCKKSKFQTFIRIIIYRPRKFAILSLEVCQVDLNYCKYTSENI